MKGRYRGKIFNIILTKETKFLLIETETEIDLTTSYWFTMKTIPN